MRAGREETEKKENGEGRVRSDGKKVGVYGHRHPVI